MEYLQSTGAKRFGVTASCWGAWANFLCCSKNLPFSAGVNYHPALGLAGVFGSSAVELAKQVNMSRKI